ncbi:hypothetical protein EQG64_34245 [Streptomyces sp. S6]|nr:hypothetical protein EQG64_34245 [Streptomyces sp. S6]
MTSAEQRRTPCLRPVHPRRRPARRLLPAAPQGPEASGGRERPSETPASPCRARLTPSGDLTAGLGSFIALFRCPGVDELWKEANVTGSVRQVVINSTGGVRTLDFAHPVVCIYGPIDTGKTTLVDCIRYPLGLPVDWRQVPSERLTSVTVHLRIEGMDIVLRRSTVADTGTVELISPYDGKVEELLDVTAQPDSGRRVVGDVLLDLLGLSELFAPPTAVALLGNGARLTFAQLYALNHLSGHGRRHGRPGTGQHRAVLQDGRRARARAHPMRRCGCWRPP